MVQNLGFKTVDQRILDEIRKEIPEEKYGHKEILWDPIYIDFWHSCLSIGKKRGNCQRGYDCIDASLKTKEILARHDIKSSVAYGKSEDGIFFSEMGHKFVIVDDAKERIDAVPLYPFVGAKHVLTEEYSEEQLSSIANIVSLGSFAVDFHENNSCKYFTGGAVRGIFVDENDKCFEDMWFDVTRKRESPEEGYRVIVDIDRDALRRFLESQGKITKDYSAVEALERLEKLKYKGVVRTEEVGWDLKLKEVGDLKSKLKDHSSVGQDLKEELERNAKEFVHLIEIIPLI